MGKKIEAYVNYMVDVAYDNKHGYSQYSRWGDPDYDCSSLVIMAVESAGIPVRTAGATYTGNMYSVFKKCGFKDVTSTINLATGKGLIRGDILLQSKHHTECYIGDGKLCGAKIDEKGTIVGATKGDQTGREICTSNYYNYKGGWQYVLRYPEDKDEPIFDEAKVNDFVERLYRIVLGRPSDVGGKNYWIDKLKRGETGANICRGFFYSVEFANMQVNLGDSAYVETLYNAFFNRASDPNGKEYWLGELSRGKPRMSLVDGFINSIEFANLCKTFGIASGSTAIPTI